ncbi:MAG: DUF4035 domain-containing protein [Ketobacter sp.]|nr:DUF4035 domain-containing protein [Ketobacter sp.]
MERPELAFKFKLALALGRTVQELDQTLTSTELTYWIAYDHLYPFGSARDNIHAAMIAATIANANRGKNQPPITVDDFMLKSQAEKRQSDTESVLAFIQSHAVTK